MRNRLLFVAAMLLASVTSFAQWLKPVPKATTDFALNDSLYLYNVGAGVFFTAGNDYNTRASVGSTGQGVMFSADPQGGDTYMFRTWTVKQKRWCWVGACKSDALGDVNSWADAPNDAAYTTVEDWTKAQAANKFANYPGTNLWKVTATEGGYYLTNTVFVGLGAGASEKQGHYGVAEYVEGKEGNTRLYFYDDGQTYSKPAEEEGADPTTEDFFSGNFYDLWVFVAPTEYGTFSAELQRYEAAVALKASLDAAQEYASYIADDIATAQAVYDNYESTLEELTEAKTALDESFHNGAIRKLVAEASENNPMDATFLITNPSFETGDLTGWNVGNSDDTGVRENSNATYTTEGCDGKYLFNTWWQGIPITQTVKDIPNGKYKLSVLVTNDALDANNKPCLYVLVDGTYESPVTDAGVKSKFAEGTREFDVTTNQVTIGVIGGNADGSYNQNGYYWYKCDNFRFTYYGGGDDLSVLKTLIDKANEAYPDLDEVKAYSGVKAYYSGIMDEAVASTTDSEADYKALSDKLTNAMDSLAKSVANYETLHSILVYANAQAGTQTENWEALSDAIIDGVMDLQTGYDEETMTDAEIAELGDMVDYVYNIAKDFITEFFEEGNTLPSGTDLTILIKNQGFDSNFSKWTVDQTMASPAWGGMDIENTTGTGKKLAEINSGNAEVYRAKFDIQQIIPNMPTGMFTLSCQAFARNDSGKDIGGEIYAVINGQEQTKALKNLLSEGSDDVLYHTGEKDPAETWDSSKPHDGEHYNLDGDLVDGTYYVPNTMSGANVYFAHGYYKNSLNIVLDESADLTIGVRDIKNGGDWILFDDFKLVYAGDAAEIYYPVIEELQTEAESYMDQITNETTTLLDDAVTAGDDAMDDADSEACKAAIAQLREAIAHAQALLPELNNLKREWFANYAYRMGLLDGTDPEGANDYLDGLVDYLSADGSGNVFEYDDDIHTTLVTMRQKITAHVMSVADSPSEAEPFDATDVIYNNLGGNIYDDAAEGGVDWANIGTIAEGKYPGWEGTTDKIGIGNGEGAVAEIYNTNYDIHQTIYGLPAGYYRLRLEGFYRHGFADTSTKALAGDSCYNHSYIYADNDSTAQLNIISYMAEYDAVANGDGTNRAKITDQTGEHYVANQANTAIEMIDNIIDNETGDSRYITVLQFQVAEGQESVTIGLKKNTLVTGDWTILRAWMLQYLGTDEPTEDATSDADAIDDIEAAPVAKAAIYNLAGQRVQKAQKGIYVINGKKIAVK